MWIIYHNEKCSKSNAAFELLTSKKINFTIVNYLETPPDIPTLQDICEKLDGNIESMIRKKDDAFATIRTSWEQATFNEKLALLADNIALLERPIVINSRNKAKIGRPDHTALLELFEE